MKHPTKAFVYAGQEFYYPVMKIMVCCLAFPDVNGRVPVYNAKLDRHFLVRFGSLDLIPGREYHTQKAQASTCDTV